MLSFSTASSAPLEEPSQSDSGKLLYCKKNKRIVCLVETVNSQRVCMLNVCLEHFERLLERSAVAHAEAAQETAASLENASFGGLLVLLVNRLPGTPPEAGPRLLPCEAVQLDSFLELTAKVQMRRLMSAKPQELNLVFACVLWGGL